MNDRRLLSRDKPHPARRGIKKPRTRGVTPGRNSSAGLLVFGERARREFENSPSPIRIFDHETMKFLAVNDAAVKFYGYSREEFLALTLKDTRHPDEHAAQLATLKESAGYLRHGKARRQIKKSGEIVVVEVVTQDILFNGRKARLSLTIDVTERNKVEEEVRRQKNLFSAVIDNLPVGVFTRDAETLRYVIRNRYCERMNGYAVDTSVGKTVYDLFPKEQADRATATDRKALETGQMQEVPEQEMLGRSGDPRIFHVRKVPLLGDDGRPWMLLGIADDITERKRAEDALRESEERFRLLAENIREVFWISTPGGENIYVSPGYEEIWGRSRESLYRNPHSWMESIHPDDLPAVRDGQMKMARGERTDVEYRIVRPDGTMRWIMDRSYPMIRSDGTRLVCGLAEDITGHKQAEQERLTHAVQQRDALVREVHHRIKNSLQGVAGLLRQKITKYPAIAPGIEEAVAQLQSVALVYGLQETRADGLLNLADMTDAICDSAENLIGGRIERKIDRDLPRPACVVGTEAVSVAVALNELVFNALKHQPAQAGNKLVHVSLRETKDAVEIRITNRGRLPASFNFSKGRALGHGLGMVRTLLASPGGSMVFNGGRDEVEVVLTLTPPLLTERGRAHAK